MSRKRIRVPGRYERPAHLRPALGDVAGEAGIVDGYRAAVRANAEAAAVRQALTRRSTAPADPASALGPLTRVELDGVDLTPYLALPGPLEHRRLEPLPDFITATQAAERALATVESAATAERVELHEAAAGGAVHEAKPGTRGLYVIDVIKSGWNTSGSRYYSADVIERDVPRVYPKGTHMHIDHPGRMEQDDRPERSLSTLAAVFVDDPWAVREDDGSVTMRTTARVFAPWQGFIAEAWPHIGVSINGNGHGEHAEREGRYGLVLEELTYGQSVDFVTKPGAGGRVVGLMESAREAAATPAGRAAMLREAATVGTYMESRIHLGFTKLADEMYGEGRVTREERITLSGAIGDALAVFVGRVEADAPQLYQRSPWSGSVVDATDEAARTREASAEQQHRALGDALSGAYGGPDRFAWVRDYDPDAGVVWFDTGAAAGPEGGGTWQQSYTRDAAGRVELLGDRIEVRARTVYDPVRPDGTAATTETTPGRRPAGTDPGSAPDTTRENDMGDNGPEVGTREADLTRERDEARLELARYRAADTAAPILTTLLAESSLPAPAQARVRADFPARALPLVEASNTLDEPRFRTLVEASIAAEGAYVAQLAEGAGVGRVSGMGAGLGAGAGAPSGALPAAFGASTREADAPDQASIDELVDMYVRRGMTREAAQAAATGRR
ncbi:hypothetical protein [Micromonospora sp. RP3T]|uniref:hypothetical protein n=1 Tax=Micromonospora sp. RP3T TaxID=2135446 RepID=UPI003D761391